MHLIVYSSREGPATILRLIRLLSSCQPYSFSTDSKISVTVSSVTKLICSYSGSNQLLTKEEKKKNHQAEDWQLENHLQPLPRTWAKSDPWHTHLSHIVTNPPDSSSGLSWIQKRKHIHTKDRNTMIIVCYKACPAPVYHPMAYLFFKLKNAALATHPLLTEYMPQCSKWQHYVSKYLIKNVLHIYKNRHKIHISD